MTDGGRNYTGVCAFDISGRLEDKPYLAIDRTGGSRNGTVYTAFTSVADNNINNRDIRVTAGAATSAASFFAPQVVTQEIIGEHTLL